MNEILLINPRKRRASKKRRSPAQRAATRKLVARNRRRKNPSPPGSRRKTRRSAVRRAVSRPANRRRYKRNPSGRMTVRGVTNLAQVAAGGAAGAIALDVVLAYLPLPAMLKVGMMGKVTKAAGAIALGAIAQRTGIVKSSTARDMTIGALTVQFAGIGRELLGQFAPGVALSAYMNSDYENALGYAGSGWNPANALNWSGGMNAYNVGEGYDVAAPGDGQPGLDAYESESAFGW